MSLLNSASLCVTPNGYKAGTLYSVIPNTTLGDMTVVRAITATRVNSAGLIESVANNVPRLDYSNGTCPSILVEPQRSNLVVQSQAIPTSPWIIQVGSVTINNIISPDGTQNASLFSSGIAIYQSISVDVAATYTATIYVKLGTATNVCLVFNNQAAWNTVGGQSFTSADGLNTSTWTRVQFTFTAPASGGVNLHLGGHSQTGVTPQSAGTFYVWGVQLEKSSYPTSYIPTTSAAVTRNADVISKTGISALIGQTEGVMFVDYNYEAKPDISGSMPIVIVSGSNEAYIFITTSGALRFELYDAGVLQSLITGTIGTVGRKKIAFAYKANDFAAYMNGVQIGTDISGTVGSMSNLYVGSYYTANYNANGGINQAVLFPTRLTNAELATLTTI